VRLGYSSAILSLLNTEAISSFVNLALATFLFMNFNMLVFEMAPFFFLSIMLKASVRFSLLPLSLQIVFLHAST
jgi:hypothetical protein